MADERFRWLDRLKAVQEEFRTVDRSLRHLIRIVEQTPDQFTELAADRRRLRETVAGVPATYILKTFVTFESALRELDRRRNQDPLRTRPASVLIDAVGSAFRIPQTVRDSAHMVRHVRNSVAHEEVPSSEGLTVTSARRAVSRFIAYLPEDWP